MSTTTFSRVVTLMLKHQRRRAPLTIRSQLVPARSRLIKNPKRKKTPRRVMRRRRRRRMMMMIPMPLQLPSHAAVASASALMNSPRKHHAVVASQSNVELCLLVSLL